jgi:hypothetical protein
VKKGKGDEENYDEQRYERGCRIRRRTNRIIIRKWGKGGRNLWLSHYHIFGFVRNPGFDSRQRFQLHLLRFSMLSFHQFLQPYTEI